MATNLFEFPFFESKSQARMRDLVASPFRQ